MICDTFCSSPDLVSLEKFFDWGDTMEDKTNMQVFNQPMKTSATKVYE